MIEHPLNYKLLPISPVGISIAHSTSKDLEIIVATAQFTVRMNQVMFVNCSPFTPPTRATSGNSAIHLLRRRRPCTVAKRKYGRPATILARANSSVEMEKQLLDSISALEDSQKKGEVQIHLLRRRNPHLFEVAAHQVSNLERTVGGFGSNNNKLTGLLQGKWKLVLTDSLAVEKNAGSITGLGSLPGAQCLGVSVVLSKDGSARTVETIKVFGGLINGDNTLQGTWRVTGKGMLEVTYASAVLLGKKKIRADSKAVLRTTYCSQKMRLGRSGSGEFYVFVKDENAT